MSKRSIHGLLAGALVACLVFVIATAATAGPGGRVTCSAGAGCSPTPAAKPAPRPAAAAPSGGSSNAPAPAPKPSGGNSSPGGWNGGKGWQGGSGWQKGGPRGGKGSGSGGGKGRPRGGRPGGGKGRANPRRGGKGRGVRSPGRSSRGRASRGRRAPIRTPGGTPTPSNPGFFDGSPGTDPLTGIPNFAIRHFRIPIFLMPIYHAAAAESGIRWEYLAAINEIETNYGRNLNVSSAGALGWMQFMPATWKQYGVDANDDGRKDPYNPVDAIFAAARYLKAAGAPKDMRKAIFAYNHAGWYVDSVVMRARLIAGMSPDMVGSLTGLAEARFPVRGDTKYADDVSEREARKRVRPGQNPSRTITDDPGRKSIRIFAKKGAPVIAVNDGVVKKMGQSRKLGRYLVLEDAFGNQFTYANLGSISAKHPVPKEDARERMTRETSSGLPGLRAHDPRPRLPATAGRQDDPGTATGASDLSGALDGGAGPGPSAGSRFQEPVVKERLFAHPTRPHALAHGGKDQLAAYQGGDPLDKPNSLGGYFLNTRGFNARDFRLVPLRKGAHVLGDTILGRVGDGEGMDAHVSFGVRPAGKGAPEVDPKPLLDGWKLLEATAIYRASGKNVLHGDTTAGQILMMPKELLQKRVLADERINLYGCGRKDIERGQVSRQVLAAIAYLTEVGLKPTITSLKCGHSYYTKSGNVSAHSSGNAVDISRFNGEPVLGHQQRGGLTYQAIRRLMGLQGTMRPHQLISLFNLGAPTVKMADHADHLHVGYKPAGSTRGGAVIKRRDWHKIVAQLGRIDNPGVPRRASKYAIPSRASDRHRGE